MPPLVCSLGSTRSDINTYLTTPSWLDAQRPGQLVDAPAAAEKREVPTIGPDELRAIFDATAGTRLYPIVVLAGACGLRRGEILGLRAGDVDLDEAVLTVRGQYGRVPGQGARIRETKTASSVRAVAMPALAVEAVREYLAWRETQPAPIDGRIFAWHPNTLDRHFRDAMLAAGLGDIMISGTGSRPSSRRRAFISA